MHLRDSGRDRTRPVAARGGKDTPAPIGQFLIDHLPFPLSAVYSGNINDETAWNSTPVILGLAEEKQCLGRLGLLVEVKSEDERSPLADLLPLS